MGWYDFPGHSVLAPKPCGKSDRFMAQTQKDDREGAMTFRWVWHVLRLAHRRRTNACNALTLGLPLPPCSSVARRRHAATASRMQRSTSLWRYTSSEVSSPPIYSWRFSPALACAATLGQPTNFFQQRSEMVWQGADAPDPALGSLGR